MNQGEVLSRTWKLLWKHKVLYLLGFIRALVWAGLTVLGFNIMYISPAEFENWVNSTGISIQAIPIIGWGLIGVVMVAALALILYLTLFFTAAQYCNAWQANTDEITKLSFGKLWRNIHPYALQMFLFSLILGGISLVAAMAVGTPVLYVVKLQHFYPSYLAAPLFFLQTAASFVLFILFSLGYAGIVTEGLGAIAAIRRAWEVAIHHKAALALLTFFLLLINIGCSALIQTPLMPLVAMSSISVTEHSSNLAALVILSIMILVLILYTGLWLSFNDTAWVVAYNRLTRPEPPASTPAEPTQTNLQES